MQQQVILTITQKPDGSCDVRMQAPLEMSVTTLHQTLKGGLDQLLHLITTYCNAHNVKGIDRHLQDSLTLLDLTK